MSKENAKLTNNSSELMSVGSSTVAKERYDLRILQALRRIIRAVGLHSRKLHGEYQITAPQLICLLTLKEEGPLTITTISRKVYLSPSTVIGIIDRLEQRELLTRERNDKDRRVVYIYITDKGRRLVEEAPSPLQDQLANALQNLPELEQVTISLSLERVVSLMEAEKIHASPILETGEINPDEGKKKINE